MKKMVYYGNFTFEVTQEKDTTWVEWNNQELGNCSYNTTSPFTVSRDMDVSRMGRYLFIASVSHEIADPKKHYDYGLFHAVRN